MCNWWCCVKARPKWKLVVLALYPEAREQQDEDTALARKWAASSHADANAAPAVHAQHPAPLTAQASVGSSGGGAASVWSSGVLYSAPLAQPRNLSDLTHYVSLYPNRLARIARYLLKQLRADLQRSRHRRVHISMRALAALVETCHSADALASYDEAVCEAARLLLALPMPQQLHSQRAAQQTQLAAQQQLYTTGGGGAADGASSYQSQCVADHYVLAAATLQSLWRWQDEGADWRRFDPFYSLLTRPCYYTHAPALLTAAEQLQQPQLPVTLALRVRCSGLAALDALATHDESSSAHFDTLIYLAVLVLAFIGAGALWVRLRMQHGRLSKLSQPAAYSGATSERWRALAPALDSSRYLSETMREVYECLPADSSVLWTTFDLTPRTLTIQGEAPSPSAAVDFTDKLKTRPGLRAYHFEAEPPTPLANGRARFHIAGTLPEK